MTGIGPLRVLQLSGGAGRLLPTLLRTARPADWDQRFADSPLEEAGFELVWGFPMSRGFFPRLAFDR